MVPVHIQVQHILYMCVYTPVATIRELDTYIEDEARTKNQMSSLLVGLILAHISPHNLFTRGRHCYAHLYRWGGGDHKTRECPCLLV
jgi:hypothetical protein